MAFFRGSVRVSRRIHSSPFLSIIRSVGCERILESILGWELVGGEAFVGLGFMVL